MNEKQSRRVSVMEWDEWNNLDLIARIPVFKAFLSVSHKKSSAWQEAKSTRVLFNFAEL
jgi:hypothetical protein